MIEVGENAPIFTLPGVRDGEITELRGEEFLGEEIVVLAFYPGDFNPSCADGETGLDELDLFTMQKDVSVLALSGDSVHSHLAFAEEYNLHMPLLSDTDGTVAADYGVAVDDEMAGYLTRRAVVVVDHTGVVQFTWEGERPGAVPNAEQIRDAIDAIGDEDTAQSRYRVGYARYMEGRRAFTSAMQAFEQDEWMIAQTDFTQAAEEFDEAGDEFNTAIRFAETEESRKYFERAENKAESLWRAADWLRQSANAFSSGEGARGRSLRSDAESPLETARELHEPPDPDEFPPETDPAEQDDGEKPPAHLVPQEGTSPDASLDADLDDAGDSERADLASPADAEQKSAPAQQSADVPSYGGGASVQPRPEPRAAAPGQRPRSYPAETVNGERLPSESEADEGEIDDEELEAITAELEQQSESAPAPDDPERNDSSVVPDDIPDDVYTGVVDVSTDVVTQVGGEFVEGDSEDSEQIDGEQTDDDTGEDDAIEEDVELDLTEPEIEKPDEEAEESGGNHGVPDSL